MGSLLLSRNVPMRVPSASWKQSPCTTQPQPPATIWTCAPLPGAGSSSAIPPTSRATPRSPMWSAATRSPFSERPATAMELGPAHRERFAGSRASVHTAKPSPWSTAAGPPQPRCPPGGTSNRHRFGSAVRCRKKKALKSQRSSGYTRYHRQWSLNLNCEDQSLKGPSTHQSSKLACFVCPARAPWAVSSAFEPASGHHNHLLARTRHSEPASIPGKTKSDGSSTKPKAKHSMSWIGFPAYQSEEVW
mmetsp:Transcript_111232/g.313936  ORF Transcript_111232/g.313936 Transcript_111232/m.313936 type:complete len:247 (-) Transcript_111232:853-1593(-)